MKWNDKKRNLRDTRNDMSWPVQIHLIADAKCIALKYDTPFTQPFLYSLFEQKTACREKLAFGDSMWIWFCQLTAVIEIVYLFKCEFLKKNFYVYRFQRANAL